LQFFLLHWEAENKMKFAASMHVSPMVKFSSNFKLQDLSMDEIAMITPPILT
jgi:hypothetical protein